MVKLLVCTGTLWILVRGLRFGGDRLDASDDVRSGILQGVFVDSFLVRDVFNHPVNDAAELLIHVCDTQGLKGTLDALVSDMLEQW